MKPKTKKETLKSITTGTGIIEHYFERYVVYYLLRIFRFNINPNIITAFSVLYALFSAYLIVVNHPIIGSVLYFFFGIPDLLDGAVARLYNRKSKFGAFFDGFADSFAEVVMLITIGVYSSLLPYFLLIAIFKLLVDYMSIRIKWIYRSTKRQENFLDYIHKMNPVNFVKFILIALTRNDTRKLAIIIGFVIGSVPFIGYYFVFLYLIALLNLIAVMITNG